MILIKNGNLLTMENDNVIVGDVLIEGDKIVKIGQNIEVDETCEIIDATDKYVMPGIIDAHCHIGLWEDGMDDDDGDGNEMTDPITPQLRAIDGINPFDNAFVEARENGVTICVTGPGSANVLGGQFVAIKTIGKCVDEMIIKDPVAVKAAFGENPKKVYSEQEKAPTTRMAIASLLRETLYEAKDYRDKLNKAKTDEDEKVEKDLKLDILVDVLDKKIPLKIHAHRADDIMTAIRICKEFDIDYTIDHCTQGHLIPEYLKDKKVIVGPLTVDRCKDELKNLSIKAPSILHENGVDFAIATDHPVIPVQYLPISAALAVREGLDEMYALKAITINPAKIIGIDDMYGSLKEGKVANIAIFNRFPLDIMAKTSHVLIDGKVIFVR